MKKATIVLAILFIVFFVSLIEPTLAAANSEISSTIEVTSPTTDKIYSGSMPLNFTISWTINPSVFWLGVKIGYTIDNSNPIFISTTVGALNGNENYTIIDFYGKETTTDEAIIVDVSALTNGEHKLTILLADGNYNVNNDFIKSYNFFFTPISFTVDNTQPTPLPNPTQTPLPSLTPASTSHIPYPSVPEFSWLIILPLFLSILSIVVLIGKRKGSSLK